MILTVKQAESQLNDLAKEGRRLVTMVPSNANGMVAIETMGKRIEK